MPPAILGTHRGFMPTLWCACERSPGPLGVLDAADPSQLALLGPTPGVLGFYDGADPSVVAHTGPTVSPGTPVALPDGTPASSGPSADPVQSDPDIEALDLAATARAAAYALRKAHPGVSFTSGRRNKEDQARAMAGNVVANRQWIEQTYAASDLRTACQKWLDDNPDKKTKAEIQAGLLSVFNAATDEQMGRFSKHLSGMAFDVQPVTDNAENIKKTIRGLAGLGKFLEKEGGLVRWHAQFD